MPSWWAKSSSKDADKKSEKGTLINKIHKKFSIVLEGKCNNGSGSSELHCDTKHASHSPISPSTQLPRCGSFAERPQALPLPLPGLQQTTKYRADPGKKEAAKAESSKESKPFMSLPLPKPPNGPDPVDAEAVVGTTSVSSDKSTDNDTPSDSRLPSPQASGYKNGKKAAMESPSSVIKKNRSPNFMQKNSREKLKATNTFLNSQVPTSHKPSRASSHVRNSQISHRGASFSAPDSNMSSPSRSPASGLNSGQNLIGGDFAGHDCSAIRNPRMTSSGPSSRIHSGAITPSHIRAGRAKELPAQWPDEEHQRHRLPLPPINISPSYSAETTPVPQSPSRADNPSSHGPRWKKGKLIGQGTYGQVYVGFDSEKGEMCAMKEVTLFSDDAKSKESAQQLKQEIALLSHLRHPNIVQYFGSEIVDDKLYIYLEYVSGGSIYKLLQEYGQLGEAALRSYTQQILSGLKYLHARDTIHRDVKGANLLVDPNGRVKLADFGMAKHISGQTGPLSFKGSSYWMAPEIILKSTDGSNLAVDIWSLGCTVLEMATTKPPWSQFEGAAAIFKIGYTKELPELPQYLSDDGKDFIRRCLQRNALDRPTAAELLEHPFVKNAALPERPSVEGFWNARKFSYSGSSDLNVPRNVPSTFSKNTCSMLPPRSPWHMSPRPCASPISSPHDISGSSTPLTGGGGAIPVHISKLPPIYSHEGMGITPRSPEIFNSQNAGPSKAYHIYQDTVQSKKDFSSGGGLRLVTEIGHQQIFGADLDSAIPATKSNNVVWELKEKVVCSADVTVKDNLSAIFKVTVERRLMGKEGFGCKIQRQGNQVFCSREGDLEMWFEVRVGSLRKNDNGTEERMEDRQFVEVWESSYRGS
ncbi:putative GPCR kinase [Heracleum sosnowskyi]|uniref:mitogen-activated protein kinase kinase kinase n=1 Tax=Heracleum sosnowskyi TaxID=360622 RepID=A0AAD8MFV6_9APIA|nr:putative GPCR kinase [Heracleum sosnowskyi]